MTSPAPDTSDLPAAAITAAAEAVGKMLGTPAAAIGQYHRDFASMVLEAAAPAIAAHATAAEREACARLAEQHGVRYEQRKSCSCGRTMRNGEPCSYIVGPALPFADLIRARSAP